MKLYNAASFTSTIILITSLLSSVNASMMRGGRDRTLQTLESKKSLKKSLKMSPSNKKSSKTLKTKSSKTLKNTSSKSVKTKSSKSVKTKSSKTLKTKSSKSMNMMLGGDEQSMILRITNQTYQQPFSEFFVMIHNSNADPLYVRGQRASDSLAQLAENGTPQDLQIHYQDMDGVLFARVHDQGVPPGGFTDILVTTSGDYPLITIASMAVNTNDCFVSLNGADLSPGDVLDTTGMDAGSEENNELCTSIPGPACPVGSGNVHSGGDGEGFVHVHRGIHGVGDLIEADSDWRNPMMRVVVM